MACSCQTAALRTFVRTITQIHSPAVVASKTLSQCQLVSLPRPNSRSFSTVRTPAGPILATRPARKFSSQSAQGGEAPAAIAPEQTTEPTTDLAAQAPEPVGVQTEASADTPAQTDAPQTAMDGPPQRVKKLKLKKKAAKEKRAAEASQESSPASPEAIKSKQATKSKAGAKSKQRVDKAQSAPSTQLDDSYLNNLEETPAADESASGETQPSWGVQKSALKAKFPGGWSPQKKLSPDALVGIRALHARFPEEYSTAVLAAKFEVSPEAIRRILKSKWEPTTEEEESRQERWFARGKQVWSRWAELGKKPPRRWRREGIVRKPFWNETRTRSGRPKSKEEIAASKYARAARVQKKISETLL